MHALARTILGKKTLSITFTALTFVFFATVMRQNASYRAALSSSVSAQSSSSSRSLNAREAAAARRRTSARKTPALKKAAPAVKPRESVRVIRGKAAAPDSATPRSRPALPEKAGCGDKLIVEPETCEDGNKTDGDGCSSSCVIEAGYQCDLSVLPNLCRELCGNGVKSPSEKCDDNNVDGGDGCGSSCKIEYGYSCTGDAPSVCVTECGDGRIAGTEQCDDGNTDDEDGCSAACLAE